MKRAIAIVCIAAIGTVFATPLLAAYQLQPQTIEAWNKYTELTEKRIDQELNTPKAFLRSDIAFLKKERAPGQGNIQIQPMTTKDQGKEIDVPDGTIHHWMAAIYIPNVTLDKLLMWVQDYDQYSKYFKEVEQSKLLSHPKPDTFDIFLRLTRTKMGVTAKFNTNHTVIYRRHDAQRASSKSVATRIAQIDKAGTPQEREFPIGDDSGYLWRLNSYWRFVERDGGVVVECETIGLSRPLGGLGNFFNVLLLGKVKAIAEGVAREALEDTLTGLRNGIRGMEKK